MKFSRGGSRSHDARSERVPVSLFGPLSQRRTRPHPGEGEARAAFPPCPMFSYHCLLTKELLSLPGFESGTFCVFTTNVINASLVETSCPLCLGAAFLTPGSLHFNMVA